MASFVEIDENNIVVRGVVVPDEQEHRGQEYLANDIGLGGRWIQTSYNTRAGVHRLGGTPLRYTYAGLGYYYNEETDAFEYPNGKYILSMDENGIYHSYLNSQWNEGGN